MKHQRKDRERMKPPKNRNEFAHELQEKKYHQRIVKMKKKQYEEELLEEEMERYFNELPNSTD
tara:strand:+ start:347 stop:535 length:189 start_codon:yes stop_codon:yes gene_type:complete